MRRNTPFSTRLSGSARETELRLRNIFQWKKKRPPVILLVLVLVIVLGCGGLVGEEPLLNPAFMDWMDEHVDEPVYLPVKWGPVCSSDHISIVSVPQTDGAYQLDFYQERDGQHAGEQVHSRSDTKEINHANYLGTMTRSKTRETVINIEPTTRFTETKLDESVTIFSAEHGTTCRWTIGDWTFNYIGPSLLTSEGNKTNVLQLFSLWNTVAMDGVTGGSVEIVSGNKDTVCYSWEKDGYCWGFVLPDMDFAAAITALNSFEKW